MTGQRIAVWAVGLLTAVAFLASQGMAASGQPDISWRAVDMDELPAEARVWVEQNHARRGVYVLPAGDVRYVMVAWGEKPTGGYSLDVIDVERIYSGQIGVTVHLETPGPDDMVTQALTYPHQVLEVDAGEETIVVNFMGDSWLKDVLGEPTGEDPEVLLRVSSPEGQPVINPLVVWGRARVFEATFLLVVEDGHYQLVEETITVSEGGPAWAEFAVAVTLPAHSSSSGAVIASVEDAADGEVREVAVEPVAFGAPSRPFIDVRGHWAEASIRRGVWAGFIHGYPDGSFRPEDTVTRAEFLKMLVAYQAGDDISTEGLEQIPLPEIRDHWVAPYLLWALEADWFSPEDLEFALDPDGVITRQEMALLVARVAGLEPSSQELAFTDADDIDEFFVSSVAAAVEHGILFGYPDQTFRPQEGLKRSESVAVIWRAAELLPE